MTRQLALAAALRPPESARPRRCLRLLGKLLVRSDDRLRLWHRSSHAPIRKWSDGPEGVRPIEQVGDVCAFEAGGGTQGDRGIVSGAGDANLLVRLRHSPFCSG